MSNQRTKNGRTRVPEAPSSAPRSEDARDREPSSFGPPSMNNEEKDEFVAPPLPGKTNPRHEMGFIVPASDDEHRFNPHHPNEGITMDFDVDPELADAAADLAGDLGSQFLEGATYAEDRSERAMRDDELSETDVPFLLEEDDAIISQEEEDEVAEAEASAPDEDDEDERAPVAEPAAEPERPVRRSPSRRRPHAG